MKTRIVKKCREEGFLNFGEYKVTKTEDFDGWKFYFNENEWYMIRPSGTEPVLRTYAEAENQQRVTDILRVGYDTIMRG